MSIRSEAIILLGDQHSRASARPNLPRQRPFTDPRAFQLNRAALSSVTASDQCVPGSGKRHLPLKV